MSERIINVNIGKWQGGDRLYVKGSGDAGEFCLSGDSIAVHLHRDLPKDAAVRFSRDRDNGYLLSEAESRLIREALLDYAEKQSAQHTTAGDAIGWRARELAEKFFVEE